MKRLLIIAATASVALWLGACNGGGDSGGGMSMARQPAPTPTPATPSPAPSDPVIATPQEFTAFVNRQMAPEVRNSETKTPVNLNNKQFKFDDNDNPHAFDQVLSQSAHNGPGG